MTRTAHAFTAAAMVMAVGVGCGGGSTAGRPVPADTDTPAAESSGPARPPRPRELRIDGKDPCALVPESDWPAFHIKEPGDPKYNETFKSPECFYDNNYGTFAITLVLTEGMEVWLERKRRGQPGEIAPVAGFPAITVTLPGYNDRCDVAVDVAKGQYLFAATDVNDDLLPNTESCGYAHQWAESAMKTLVAS